MKTSAWLYPWDVADLGVPSVARLAERGRLTAVNVAASYHSLFATVPDNPRRHIVELPRSAIYFRPDPGHWRDSELRPHVSPWLDELGDAFTLGRRVADAAGCALTAWTVCLHNGLGHDHPELAVQTLWGEPVTAALCVRHPAVRRYARALVRDISMRADRVQLESAHWLPLPHHPHAKLAAPDPDTLAQLAATCFCAYCRSAGADAGVDTDALMTALQRRWRDAYRGVAARPLSHVDGLDGYLAVRAAAVTSLVDELVTESPVPVEFVSFGDRSTTGVRLADVERAGAAVRILAYGHAERVRAVLAAESAAADRPAALHVGLSLLPEHVPDEDEFARAAAAARAGGVESAALYHLGLVDNRRRGWLSMATEA